MRNIDCHKDFSPLQGWGVGCILLIALSLTLCSVASELLWGVDLLIILINFALFSLSFTGSSPYKGLMLAEILMVLGNRTTKSKASRKK